MSKIQNKELRAVDRKFQRILSLLDQYITINSPITKSEINSIIIEITSDIVFITNYSNYRIPSDGIEEEEENQ